MVCWKYPIVCADGCVVLFTRSVLAAIEDHIHTTVCVDRYMAFLGLWTAVALLATKDERLNYTPARYAVEVLGTVGVLLYLLGEVLEWRRSRTYSERVKAYAAQDLAIEMDTISETWPDFYYLHTRLGEENHKYLSDYFASVWNLFDIISYTLLLLSEVSCTSFSFSRALLPIMLIYASITHSHARCNSRCCK